MDAMNGLHSSQATPPVPIIFSGNIYEYRKHCTCNNVSYDSRIGDGVNGISLDFKRDN